VLHFHGLPFLEVVLPWLAILLFSLSFHEAAHALTADRLGDPTARRLGRITLNPLAHIDWIGTVLFPLLAIYSGFPLIGWAKPVPVSMLNLRAPRRDFAIVAAAGPLSNLLLATISAAVLIALSTAGGGLVPGPMILGDLLVKAVRMNLMLAVFNLIPVPPLDGGNVLAGLVSEPIARAIDQLRPYGFLILYGLMFTGALGAIFSPVDEFVSETLLR
jgi:Zn-dependent protease